MPEGDFDSLLNALGKVLEKSSQAGGSWRVNRDWAREHFEASVIGVKQMKLYEQAR